MADIPADWPPPPDGTPKKRDRVAYCLQLMRENRWVRGETAPLLAAHWGLATNTVEGDACDASHIIRARLDDADVSTLRAEVVVSLRKAKQLARKGAKEDPIRAGKLLVDQAKAFAEVTGCAAPRRQQVEVKTTEADDPWTEPVDEGKP